MINKFQVGGAAPNSQEAQIQQAIAQISQATGEQPETIVAALKNGKNNFKKVLQALQQGDVQTAKQLIQQLAGKPMARLGAKLNYIRTLKGACPEGQEVKYFKEGGQMKCKCVDKAAGGEKVKDGKKEIADFKKKKACGGMKAKLEGGKKIKKPVNPADTVHVGGRPYSLTNMNGSRVDDRFPAYSGAVEKKDRAKAKAGDKDAKKRQAKAEEVTAPKNGAKMPKEKCGGKARKHQFGGSLNGIPFISLVANPSKR